jgi:hypothetical protein
MEIEIQTVQGWYCPHCGSFNVVKDTVDKPYEDKCESCSTRVTIVPEKCLQCDRPVSGGWRCCIGCCTQEQHAFGPGYCKVCPVAIPKDESMKTLLGNDILAKVQAAVGLEETLEGWWIEVWPNAVVLHVSIGRVGGGDVKEIRL